MLAVLAVGGCSAREILEASREKGTAVEPALILQTALPRQPIKLRILVGGDLMPHRPRLLAPESISTALAPLSELLRAADASVANYETATGDPRIFGEKAISLAASPAWMGEVRRAGWNALAVANNHACDLGKAGLERTIAATSDLGVVALGADSSDPWKAKVLVEKSGHRVCAVAWTTFVNAEGRACKGSGELAIAAFDRRGTDRIERAIQRARAGGCDAVVAILHGGREYAPQIWGPRLQARRAAEAGADAVVIHHPHVASPVDMVSTRDGRRVPVFASVGNLVSNQGESWRLPMRPESRENLISLNAWTRLGVLADLEWTWPSETADARPTLTWGFHLLWTENDHAYHRDDPLPRIVVRPVDPTNDRALLDRLETDDRGPKSLLVDSCWIEASEKRCDAVPAGRRQEPMF